MKSNALRDLIKLAVGTAIYSREKVEELVNELLDEHEITPEESKQYVEEILEEMKTQGDEMKKKVKAWIREELEEWEKERNE